MIFFYWRPYGRFLLCYSFHLFEIELLFRYFAYGSYHYNISFCSNDVDKIFRRPLLVGAV